MKFRNYPTVSSDFLKLPYRPTEKDIKLNCPTRRVITVRLATLLLTFVKVVRSVLKKSEHAAIFFFFFLFSVNILWVSNYFIIRRIWKPNL